MPKVTPFLMFNDQLEDAVAFYTSNFPGSRIHHIMRDGKDGPIRSAEFVIGGNRFMAYNGGPHFKFTEAFSFFLECRDQQEVDKYWTKLVRAGATPSQCGWITDPFGISWQIIPRRFMELINETNTDKVQAVMKAAMKMVKLNMAELERAYEQA